MVEGLSTSRIAPVRRFGKLSSERTSAPKVQRQLDPRPVLDPTTLRSWTDPVRPREPLVLEPYQDRDRLRGARHRAGLATQIPPGHLDSPLGTLPGLTVNGALSISALPSHLSTPSASTSPSARDMRTPNYSPMLYPTDPDSPPFPRSQAEHRNETLMAVPPEERRRRSNLPLPPTTPSPPMSYPSRYAVQRSTGNVRQDSTGSRASNGSSSSSSSGSREKHRNPSSQASVKSTSSSSSSSSRSNFRAWTDRERVTNSPSLEVR